MADWRTTIDGLNANQTYDIKVVAVNASGESDFVQTTATTNSYSAPGIPVLVGGSTTQTGYTVTFTPVPVGENPIGYNLYLTGGTLIGTVAGGRTDTTIIVSGRTAGQTDEIYVAAYDANGDGNVSGLATVYLQPSDITITLTDRSDDTFVLTYSGGLGASSFEVYSDTTLLTATDSGNLITVTGLTPQTSYPNVSVVAKNSDSSASTTSNIISVIETLLVLHSPGVTITYNDSFTFNNWSSVAPLTAPSNIIDVDLIDSVGGSAITGINVTDAANAFDNSEATFAVATDSSNDNVELGWAFGVGSEQVVKQIRIKTGIDGAASTVRAYTIQADNGAGATTLTSGELPNYPNTWHTIDLMANNTAYANYNILFSSKWATTSDVAEIEMLTVGDEVTYTLPAGSTPQFLYTFPTPRDFSKAHYVEVEVKSDSVGQFITMSLDGFGTVPITINEADVWETKYLPVPNIARSNRANISTIEFIGTDTAVERSFKFKSVKVEEPNYGISLNTVQVGNDVTLYWSQSLTPLDKTVFVWNTAGFDSAYTEVELANNSSSYQLTGLTPSISYFLGVATKDFDGSLTYVTEIENALWIGVPVAPTVAPTISDITAIDFTVDFASLDGAYTYELYVGGVLYGTYSNDYPITNVSFPGSPAVPCDVTYKGVNPTGTTVESPVARVVPLAAPTWDEPVPANGADYSDPLPYDITQGDYTVTWDAVEGADTYDIELSLSDAVDGNGNFVTQIFFNPGIVPTSYSISDFAELVYGARCFWHVRAVNTYGAGHWFNPANDFIVDVPVVTLITPVNLATEVGLLFSMDWTPAVDVSKWAGVEYEWELSDTSPAVISSADVLTTTAQYNDTPHLSVNTTYSLRVRGFTTLAPKTVTDNWSAPHSFATISILPAAFGLLLPADLTVLECAPNTITFTWEESIGADGYKLYVDDAPPGSPMVYQIAAGTTSHGLQLPSGRDYTWYVDAENEVGTTTSNTTRNFKTKVAAPTLDVGLTGNDTSAQAGGQAIVTWSISDNTGVVGYRVKWGTVSGVWGNTSADIVGASETSFTVTGLTNGQTYYFVVVAYDVDDDESLTSAESGAILVSDTVAPQTSTFVATAEAGTGAIDLAWTNPTEFDHVVIVRKVGGYATAGTDPEGTPDGAATTVLTNSDAGVLTYIDNG